MKSCFEGFQYMMVASITLFLAGCDDAEQADAPSEAEQATHLEDDHAHEEHTHGAGPHEGTLADWGGGVYHVEFTVDHEQQQATVYVLGDDGATPAPIAAEEIQLSITDPAMQVTLKAVPQDGDPEGASSRFVGTHESLGVVQEYAGTVTGVVDGTPYSGDFKEEPHAAH